VFIYLNTPIHVLLLRANVLRFGVKARFSPHGGRSADAPNSYQSHVRPRSPLRATGWLLSKTLWATGRMDSGHPGPVLTLGIVEREARLERSSAKHAHLAVIYGRVDPDLSPEQALRRSMLARYHAMLAEAALKREQVNPNRQSPAPNPSDEGQLAFGF
jgi:hypothetical protein